MCDDNYQGVELEKKNDPHQEKQQRCLVFKGIWERYLCNACLYKWYTKIIITGDGTCTPLMRLKRAAMGLAGVSLRMSFLAVESTTVCRMTAHMEECHSFEWNSLQAEDSFTPLTPELQIYMIL